VHLHHPPRCLLQTCSFNACFSEEARSGVAARRCRQQKPRFLLPETQLMSEKSAAGDFFPMNQSLRSAHLNTAGRNVSHERHFGQRQYQPTL
jgi:hypothetical protein